jgi:hypothetical protein
MCRGGPAPANVDSVRQPGGPPEEEEEEEEEEEQEEQQEEEGHVRTTPVLTSSSIFGVTTSGDGPVLDDARW